MVGAHGKLTLAEFEALWLEFMRQRMVRGFQRIDRDGDAEITIVEFLEPYSRIVERMDRNEDGVLDKNDRRKRMKRHHRQERKMENATPDNSNKANCRHDPDPETLADRLIRATEADEDVKDAKVYFS